MQPKPGYLTSEFWAATITALIGFLNQAFGWNIPPETFASVAAVIAGYAISRGLAKKPAPTTIAKLLVIGALLPAFVFGTVSCSDTSGVSPTFTSSTVGKVGLDLNTAAQQALADYAHVKTNGVDYVWALSEAFNAYATIAKTRGDVENLVAQWGGSSSSTTADRLADLFGASSGSTRERMLTLAQAALDTATNLTKPKTSSIWMSPRRQSLAFAREDMRRGLDKGDQRRGKLDKGDPRRNPESPFRKILRAFGVGA